MSDSFEKRDTLPLWWIGRMPVYFTTVLAALLVVGLLLNVFLETGGLRVYQVFGFVPVLFWQHWHLWQVVTYPFVNEPNFFFLFAVIFFYFSGVGVESYLGRRTFYKVMAVVIGVPALVATVIWLFFGMPQVVYPMCLGLEIMMIGVFLANATLYPNAEVFGWITMKWLAFAGIVLCCLNYVRGHDWPGFIGFAATCAVVHAYVRYERGHWSLPRLRFPARKPKFRVVPKPSLPPREIPQIEMAESATDVEVDTLLDKIAKSGLASLTDGERARLEKAREELLKKERE